MTFGGIICYLLWDHLPPSVGLSPHYMIPSSTSNSTIFYLLYDHLSSPLIPSDASHVSMSLLGVLSATPPLIWDLLAPIRPSAFSSHGTLSHIPRDHLLPPMWPSAYSIGSPVTFQGVIFHLPLNHLSPPMDAIATSLGIISKFSWAHLLSQMDSPVTSLGPTCHLTLSHLSPSMDPSTPFLF